MDERLARRRLQTYAATLTCVFECLATTAYAQPNGNKPAVLNHVGTFSVPAASPTRSRPGASMRGSDCQPPAAIVRAP